jgi:hypothetical protein
VHQQALIRQQAEREAVYRWLVDVYAMPCALARTIAEQHRIGGELILWAARARATAAA